MTHDGSLTGRLLGIVTSRDYRVSRMDPDMKVRDFMTAIYGNVLVMDSGARGSTTTFVENGQGDVLIAWENEALFTLSEYPDEYELVTPSISIKAEPSVAIVDVNAEKDGGMEIASEAIKFPSHCGGHQ